MVSGSSEIEAMGPVVRDTLFAVSELQHNEPGRIRSARTVAGLFDDQRVGGSDENSRRRLNGLTDDGYLEREQIDNGDERLNGPRRGTAPGEYTLTERGERAVTEYARRRAYQAGLEAPDV